MADKSSAEQIAEMIDQAFEEQGFLVVPKEEYLLVLRRNQELETKLQQLEAENTGLHNRLIDLRK